MGESRDQPRLPPVCLLVAGHDPLGYGKNYHALIDRLRLKAMRGSSAFRTMSPPILPWLDHEVAGTCRQVGLKIVKCRYYNLSPLKFIHNQVVPEKRKNEFMHIWFELEEFLNEDESTRTKLKSFFMGLYLHVRKI